MPAEAGLMRRCARLAWVGCGWLSLALGLVGIFLPLLPTTPFILLAAFCFSKGSPQLHRWLCSTKVAGKTIRDWELHGVIRPQAKRLATVMMLLLISYPMFFMGVPPLLSALMAGTTGAGLAFIWSRPSRAENSQ
mgnify:CR=1 FL=1